MKTLFIILLLIVQTAFAGEVALLTSLKLKDSQIRKLEQKFLKKLQNSGHELIVHHDTDPVTLYKVLTSPNTVGVIWVSHAAKEKQTKQAGMVAEAIILDKAGNDVKNFFTLVPQNLRFLAIVGCEAKPIIDGFRSRGNYDGHSDLEIMSFEKKVIMQRAFGKALDRGVEVLSAVAPYQNNSSEGDISFSLSRQFSGMNALGASWIEVGDRVIALYEQNETSIQQAYIPLAHWNQLTNKNIKHKLVLKEGEEMAEMGRLQFAADRSIGSWRLFELNGKVLGGKDQQLYIFKALAP